ncbi:MAG TPA: maltose alpha-D-glucosyltransferase [Myxococcota bacterium]
MPKSDPHWYKDAIFYEIRVGAYQDSDGDGIGDFRGLAQRLDYLQDLGVTALWLLPFCPSPMRDDGYDISDYTGIHPDCGTLDDFKAFLREAHRRGLRVVSELVINHTSDQHPWFQRARRAPPGSRWRNFYVWSDSQDRYAEARVIFQDFEPSNWSWDPLAKAYYWHRFYSHQPDLNFDSADVRKAVLKFLDFWFDLGVDGLRLDAIPYLYERDGTNCENLPETHAFLRELRSHVDTRYSDRMLLAEANQWPEDAVAYFGKGDESHVAFHFPVMPRLFMALHMEDRYPIIDILQQTPPIPETCQWALFLRNHDELTLEMVTDEERDYMYRVYAHDAQARINLGIRRRLAPLLGNDRRRIELMNALLFSLPGTPILYYGDEIGMGDNFYLGDRNGVRTPMQWSPDRNAGFSRANPQRLYLPVIIDPAYHYEAVNVETQQGNPHSLLHWTKRLIALRKRNRAFGRGTLEFLHPENHKVLAFLRCFGDERILIVANLSRYVEYVELDLSAYRGMRAVEIFGSKSFPPIGDLPYLLTLGPHAFYWFRIEPDSATGVEAAHEELATLRVAGSWQAILRGEDARLLEAILPRALQRQRWFGGKARPVESLTLLDAMELPTANGSASIALLRVEQSGGAPQLVSLPLAFVTGAAGAQRVRHHPEACFAELEVEARDGVQRGWLIDALELPACCEALLDLIGRRRSLRGETGVIRASTTRAYRELRGADADDLTPARVRAEQSNTSILFGQRMVFKLFRRLSEGTNPDLELGSFLTERARFSHAPRVAGALEYEVERREPTTVAILQEYIENEGDAWQFTLDQLSLYYEQVLARQDEPEAAHVPAGTPLDLIDRVPPAILHELLGGYLETSRLLGQRTADLHLALASEREDEAFAPEPFSSLYQRSLYQSARNSALRNFALLRAKLAELAPATAAEAQALLAREEQLLEVLRSVVGPRLGGMRIRVHGDYHLGQLLYTGNDFIVTDFEGEPARSIGERRLKRSPLRDVAGMLRSFDYAAHTALREAIGTGVAREEEATALGAWARFWSQWVGSNFLRGYLPPISAAGLIPQDRDELRRLLRALLLDKSVYELGYELNHRPGWARVPIHGTLELLEATAQ